MKYNFFSLSQEKKEKVIKRFNNSFEKKGSDECWLWKGTIEKTGYGRIKTAKRVSGSSKQETYYLSYAHRLSWMLFYKTQIPDTLFCCHSCDVRHCVNPHHIFLGTMQQNLRDSMQKDRRRAKTLLERLEIAEAVLKGMSFSIVGKAHNISISTVGDYIHSKDIEAKYGKICLKHRIPRIKGNKWKKTEQNTSSGTPQNQPSSTSTPTGQSAK